MPSVVTIGGISSQLNDVKRYVTNEAGSANLPGKENGPQDAYRHLLLSAELTRVFGSGAAYLLLTQHELENLLWDRSKGSASQLILNNHATSPTH